MLRMAHCDFTWKFVRETATAYRRATEMCAPWDSGTRAENGSNSIAYSSYTVPYSVPRWDSSWIK